jgi:hypothetical protein
MTRTADAHCIRQFRIGDVLRAEIAPVMHSWSVRVEAEADQDAASKAVQWWKRADRLTYLKAGISLIALVALVSRMVWPWLKVDAISLGLLVLMVIPWVSGLFESLEFPGGWKISFRNLERAAEAIPDPPDTVAPSDEPTYVTVQDLDPRLALVGLRIELEARLQRLAAVHGIQRRGGAGGLLTELARREVLPRNVEGALREVLAAANAAAHGADVPSGAQDFAFAEGPRILGWLDSLIAGLQEPPR